MNLRILAPLLATSLLLPADVLADPPANPWVIPGFPDPFHLPALPTAPFPIPGAPTPPVPIPPAAAGSPVVLELFTSEDCPMCESAEYEVKRLTVTQPVPGVRLIPLAFHVEFYGGSSTTDPYVLQAATQRQADYDAARGRVYTPQGIVDGDREFTGSNDGAARAAITAAAGQAKASVDVTRSARFAGPTELAVSVRYGPARGGHRATLTAVLAENGLVKLNHGGQTDYDRVPLAPVVRTIRELGAASPGGGSVEATLAIPAAAVRANLTVVVLLSDGSTRHILGVGTMPAGVL